MSNIALIFAVIPFFFSVRTSSNTMINGEVIAASSLDYVALVCGALALLTGGVELYQQQRPSPGFEAPEDAKRPLPWMALAALLLGGFQVVRGLGWL